MNQKIKRKKTFNKKSSIYSVSPEKSENIFIENGFINKVIPIVALLDTGTAVN